MDSKKLRFVRLPKILDLMVVILSVGLIAFISYDTFTNTNFLHHKAYMHYQFWVCVVFLADIIARFWIHKPSVGFYITQFFFLIISIPYLNIIEAVPSIHLSQTALYFVRFIPLARSIFALAIVASFLSRTWAAKLAVSYTIVIVAIVYMSTLIFYYEEHPVNPAVKGFLDAFWWAGTDVTTLGSNIFPVTPVGKVLSVVLSVLGIIMFPLLTVWFGSLFNRGSGKGNGQGN